MRLVSTLGGLIAAALATTAIAATTKPAPKAAGQAMAKAEIPGGRMGMLGATTSQIRQRLGAPDVAHNEGRGAFWTYRLPECALFVFFQNDDGKGLKVSGLSSGPRKRGQPQAPTEACVTSAESR